MKRLTTLLLLFPASAALAQDSGFIPLEDPLDEVDAYCTDVSGTMVDTAIQIQVHTCKDPATEDQLFSVDVPRLGNISVEDYDLCLAPRRVAEGAPLFTTPCTRDSKQHWI